MSYALFIEEIRQRPDDDEPRLVFADWLEEHGDVWGQLIRGQCELARSQPGSPTERTLRSQVDAFMKRHHGRFYAPLYRWGATHVCYERGFLDHCRFLISDDFDKCLDQLKPLVPLLRSLTIVPRKQGFHWRACRCEQLGRVLAELAEVADVRSLDLHECGIEACDMEAVVRSRLVDSLEMLNVAWNLCLGQEGVELLWRAAWQRLRVLDLQGMSFSAARFPNALSQKSPASELILVNEGLKWMRGVFPGKVMVV